ncbi:hypothetical protein BH11ACT6_BH11ACT6_14770 [soil metagenome]
MVAIDWSIRGEYIAKRSMTPVIANEDDGTVYGINAWPFNDVDTRKYERQD